MAMHLVLATVTGEKATTGILRFVVIPDVLYTIERSPTDPSGVVCVPAGDYALIPYQSPAHGATWCLHNPQLGVYGDGPAPSGSGGHDYCELHSMNFATQSKGCIGIGLANTSGVNPDDGQVEPEVTGGLHGGMAKLLAILGPLSAGHVISISRGPYRG